MPSLLRLPDAEAIGEHALRRDLRRSLLPVRVEQPGEQHRPIADGDPRRERSPAARSAGTRTARRSRSTSRRSSRGSAPFAPRRKRGNHRPPRFVVEHAPRGDLVERAEAAAAKTRSRVHLADADARRNGSRVRRGSRWRVRVHRANPSSGDRASSARATRDTGARPRASEMKRPATRSFVMSTPVSMPSPSSR